MIPYFPAPFFEIGSIRFDSWLLLVVTGIAIGTEYARARAIRTGLSVKVTVDTTLLMVAMGFMVSHVVHVLVYNPDQFREDWTRIMPWYGGYSSYGGFLGAGLTIPLFLRWKKAPTWAYVDNLAIAFVLGWAFGRTGCFSAHDHIGRTSDFFLAVDFPERLGGPRHDLGLYEAILAWAMSALFFALDRKNPNRFHGFYSAWTILLYAPVRFFMDFLRAEDLESISKRSDVRWAGLTPAQYGSVALFFFGVWIYAQRRRAGQHDLTGESDRDFEDGGKKAPEQGEHTDPDATRAAPPPAPGATE